MSDTTDPRIAVVAEGLRFDREATPDTFSALYSIADDLATKDERIGDLEDFNDRIQDEILALLRERDALVAEHEAWSAEPYGYADMFSPEAEAHQAAHEAADRVLKGEQ
jgi:hypothetical protein